MKVKNWHHFKSSLGAFCSFLYYGDNNVLNNLYNHELYKFFSDYSHCAVSGFDLLKNSEGFLQDFHQDDLWQSKKIFRIFGAPDGIWKLLKNLEPKKNRILIIEANFLPYRSNIIMNTQKQENWLTVGFYEHYLGPNPDSENKELYKIAKDFNEDFLLLEKKFRILGSSLSNLKSLYNQDLENENPIAWNRKRWFDLYPKNLPNDLVALSNLTERFLYKDYLIIEKNLNRWYGFLDAKVK